MYLLKKIEFLDFKEQKLYKCKKSKRRRCKFNLQRLFNFSFGGVVMQINVDSLWVIISAALVFFMQPGFQMVESGLTREKNSINVAIKNLTDIGISLLLYWIVGFAFMFGSSKLGLIGATNFIPGMSKNLILDLSVFLLFQTMFCSTSATIVSGAVAERMKYSSYIICTVIISSIIYPIFGHWAWGGLQPSAVSDGAGWLYKLGFVDFAGSTVVHSVGGYVGLAGIIILGARKGRFPENGKPKEIQGCDIPMAVAGVFVLWFGWIGFNGGSTLALTNDVPEIIMNTCIGAGAGMIAALFVGWAVTGLPNVNFVLNGTLAGLVAVTANCHCVTPGESAIIGAVGGIVMLGACKVLELLKLDDAVGAIPVHLCAGVWGTLAVGIFGDPEKLGTNPIFGSQILAQLIGVVVCGVWSFGIAFLALSIINKIKPIRVSDEDENKGLNIAEHGASTEIFDLYETMSEQARTGDVSLRLKVEPFTEIGQISKLYNSVMETLEESVVEKESFGALLNSVPYGMFMINSDYTINSQYSTSTPRLLCCPDPSRYSFPMLMARLLPKEKVVALNDFLKNLFDMDFKSSAIVNANPLKHIEMNIRHKSMDPTQPDVIDHRILTFEFVRVFDTQHTKVLHVVISAQGNY